MACTDPDRETRERRRAEPTRRLDELTPHPEAALTPSLRPREYAAFVAEIAERGVGTPVEITAEGTVLDGHERLRAARELALDAIPVRLVSPPDERSYMLRAALARKHLSASQRAALALELEEIDRRREEARRRQRANLRQNAEAATLPPRGESTRERAARIAGVSPRTVQDAETVRQLDRDLFEQVRAGSLKANQAAERVRRERRDRALAPADDLPAGRFAVLLADPPWQLGSPESSRAPENHYPTLPLADIKAIDVPAADDAVLFLWAVSSLLRETLDVVEAWGFTYATSIVWVKPRIGLGAWVRHRHELLLVARRGDISPPPADARPDSVIEAPNRRHSEKPERVYALIERAYPRARKLELFARGRPRPGWAAWGNEVER